MGGRRQVPGVPACPPPGARLLSRFSCILGSPVGVTDVCGGAGGLFFEIVWKCKPRTVKTPNPYAFLQLIWDAFHIQKVVCSRQSEDDPPGADPFANPHCCSAGVHWSRSHLLPSTPLHHARLLLAGPSREPLSSPVKQHLLQEWGRHAWYDGCVLVEEGRLGASVLTSPNNRAQFCSFTRPECGLEYLTLYSPPSMFLVVAVGSLRHWFIWNIHVFSFWPLCIYWNVDLFFSLK